MAKRIPLTQGYYAVVNDADYEFVMQNLWFVTKNGNKHYAATSIKGQVIYLHRFLLNAPKGTLVDHINNDGLDNRRENLRVVVDSENKTNRGLRSDNTSGYKGIKYDKRIGKWVARVFSDGHEVYLGSFDSPKEAASAYDNGARVYYKEYAWLNFPLSHESRKPLESMSDDHTTIRLTNNLTVKIDREFWDYLSRYRWHTTKAWGNKFYAHRGGGKRGVSFYMHHEIMEQYLGRKLHKGEIVDHQNGDTLDNRIANLRIADPAQSSANTGMRKNNKSGYRGVSWNKNAQKWIAMVGFRNQKHYLGLFDDAEQAHGVVEQARDKIHGEWKRR